MCRDRERTSKEKLTFDEQLVQALSNNLNYFGLKAQGTYLKHRKNCFIIRLLPISFQLFWQVPITQHCKEKDLCASFILSYPT